MILKHSSPLLFATMLVTVPFPCLFFSVTVCCPSADWASRSCGLDPRLTDPVALIFVVPAFFYIVLYGACLRWLAGFLSRRLVLHPALAGRYPRQLLIAALLILASLPVYSFD